MLSQPQPYELAYQAHLLYRTMIIFHHILLLYIPGFIPYHNGSNGEATAVSTISLLIQTPQDPTSCTQHLFCSTRWNYHPLAKQATLRPFQ